MNSGVKVLFGAVLGFLYVIYGLLQFVQAVFGPVESLEVLLVPGDVFSGFVLLVIGAVFLTGVRRLSMGAEEGTPWIYVGILLSVGFGLVALCSLGAGAIEATVFAEGGTEPWPVVDAITPLLYLAAIGALGFFAWVRELLWGIRAT